MTYSRFQRATGDEVQLPASVTADIIREARLGKAYGIEEMAIATGLTAAEIAKIEAGERAEPEYLLRIARVLGLPLG
ncbi:helix-turn-helix domain-containing protein [Labrys okinawensis]|uniref:helix-turn-helix domain-containing protein n=1 Tax=Labrys okinawensis TaxID=346911 RepID=UPI0039BD8F35